MQTPEGTPASADDGITAQACPKVQATPVEGAASPAAPPSPDAQATAVE
jgi:hypothetical protein